MKRQVGGLRPAGKHGKNPFAEMPQGMKILRTSPHDMNQGMVTVFVYGTLRRGGSNHFRMDGAEFVMQGVVRGRLYGIDWYPGLVADQSAGWVTGELYQVSAAHLAALDDFEGPEYTRGIVNAHPPGGDGPPCQAWAWLWTGGTDESRRIAGGDWLAAG
jgi:gamma-glutamylcyclotransferase (GGCT)/AIG2-like uncharacterized protein YtfP